MQWKVISLYSCLLCFDKTHKKNQMMFKTEEKLLTSAIFGGLAEHTLFGFSFPPCSQISCFIAHYGTQCGVLCALWCTCSTPSHCIVYYSTQCGRGGVLCALWCTFSKSPLYLMVKIYWNKVSFATVRKARSCLVSIFLPVHKRLHFSLQIIAHSGRQARSSLCNSRRWNCLTLGETFSHSCSSSALCAMLLPTPRIRIFSSQKKVRFKFSPHIFWVGCLMHYKFKCKTGLHQRQSLLAFDRYS